MLGLFLGWEPVCLELLGQMKGVSLLNLSDSAGHLSSHLGQLDLISLAF